MTLSPSSVLYGSAVSSGLGQEGNIYNGLPLHRSKSVGKPPCFLDLR